jgi:hypothetical protein
MSYKVKKNSKKIKCALLSHNLHTSSPWFSAPTPLGQSALSSSYITQDIPSISVFIALRNQLTGLYFMLEGITLWTPIIDLKPHLRAAVIMKTTPGTWRRVVGWKIWPTRHRNTALARSLRAQNSVKGATSKGIKVTEIYCLHVSSYRSLPWVFVQPWRWKQCIPLKYP